MLGDLADSQRFRPERRALVGVRVGLGGMGGGKLPSTCMSDAPFSATLRMNANPVDRERLGVRGGERDRETQGVLWEDEGAGDVSLCVCARWDMRRILCKTPVAEEEEYAKTRQEKTHEDRRRTRIRRRRRRRRRRRTRRKRRRRRDPRRSAKEAGARTDR